MSDPRARPSRSSDGENAPQQQAERQRGEENQQAGAEQRATAGPQQAAGEVQPAGDRDQADAGSPEQGDDQRAGAEPGSEQTDGDDGWETSNDLPGVIGPQGPEAPSAATAQGERTGADGEEEVPAPGGDEDRPGGGGDEDRVASGGDMDEGEGGAAEEDGEGGRGDELARALEDLDGEILDERLAAGRPDDVASGAIAATTGGGIQQAAGKPGQGTSQSGGGDMPGRRSVASQPPATPSPPLPARPDTPDAKDDDVVARQLREAAMAETDPDLRERLWEEYERYKAGL